MTTQELIDAAKEYLEAGDAYAVAEPGQVSEAFRKTQAARARLRTALSACEREKAGAIEDIAAERRRQIEAEGWTPEHDDAHAGGEMAAAAAAYAMSAYLSTSWRALAIDPIGLWPWDVKWWKPTNPRRDLVKAGALIAAEIERLDRAPKE